MIRYIKVTNNSCKICVCMEEDFEDILCEILYAPTSTFLRDSRLCLIESDIAIDKHYPKNLLIEKIFNVKLFGDVIITKLDSQGNFCSLLEKEAIRLKNEIKAR